MGSWINERLGMYDIQPSKHRFSSRNRSAIQLYFHISGTAVQLRVVEINGVRILRFGCTAAAVTKHGRIRKNRALSRRRPIVSPPQHAGIAVVMPLMNPGTHQQPLSARIHQLQRHEAAHALWRRHNAIGRDVRRRSPTTVKVMKMTGSRSSWRLPRPGECQIC